MPRRGPGTNEKAKDFGKSIKRLFKNLSKWKFIMVIAIILAMTSSIFSLISPNKLSDITDTITKGITPNEEVLETLITKISDNFTNQEVLQNKIQTILESPDISLEDKLKLQNVLININNQTDEEKYNTFLSLPSNILNILMPSFEVDNVTIDTNTQIETLKVLSTMDSTDTNSILESLDKLPETVGNLVKPKMDMDLIKDIALFLLILYIISSIFGYIEQFSLSTVSNRFAQTLRSSISQKINKLPLKYFDNHEMGDILSRVTNDVDTISQNLNNSLANLVSAVTLFIGCIVMMFYTNGTMAITAILSSLIGFLFMSLILSKSQKYFNQKQTELGNLNAHIEEIYSGHTIVKAYNGEEKAKKEFNRLNESLYNCNQKSQFLSGLMPSLMNFIGNFGYVAVCVVGAYLVINDIITFGVIVAFIVYVRLFSSPLSQIAQAMSSLQSSAAASERVFEFLDEPEMDNQSNITKQLDNSKVRGNIEFKNVHFGYDPKKVIIKDFSINVSNGKKVAIVGPTGAGKTTLVNLLMKFYEINSGDILIDGISIKELSRENIHSLFTMVLQDTWLFAGTVRENIKFNRSDVNDQKIWESLHTVGVDHFVKTLPGGLDAMIDDSESISQGQKQLLTIARGMVEDSPFLILDEATSNVDTRTEELVQMAMDKLTEGRTSFIIAHRLSTIKNADIILVMKDGNIVEQGSHEELINKNGFYAELYNAQFTKENS